MTERIAALARTLGNAGADEMEALTAAAEAAEQELRRALRPGVSAEQCASAFALAGAWLTLAALETCRSAAGEESFTAGDLTVRGGDGARRADELRAKAWKLMSAWTKDRRFAFYGVRG